MKEYKAINPVVMAEQYTLGLKMECPKVRYASLEITYSVNGDMYYISGSGEAKYWLGVDKISEAPDIKSDGGFSGHIKIVLPTGEVYYRTAYPFAYWSVKTGDIKSISSDNDLVLDYAAYHGWSIIEGHATIYDIQTHHWRRLFDKEWVIETPEGYLVLSDEKFKQRYYSEGEPVVSEEPEYHEL